MGYEYAAEYKPAAICRKGHVATSDFELSPELAGKYCKTCGAEVLRACPSCGEFIRGRYFVMGVIGNPGIEYSPPDFCEDCGKPFPWLSREGRIHLLQNILDGADIADADKLLAGEQLEILRDPELGEEEQARRWARFRQAAPAVWAADQAQRIIETVLQAGTKAMMDRYMP